MNAQNHEARVVLKSLGERPVAYNKTFSQMTGSVTAGLLLSQLLYWHCAKDGRQFWKTNEGLVEELGMSIDEVKGAKARLVELGLVKVAVKGMPRRSYYCLNETVILAQISSWWKSHQLENQADTPVGGNPTDQSVEIPPTSQWKSHQPVSGNPTSQSVEIPPTTSENVAENTQRGGKAPSPEVLCQQNYKTSKALLPDLPPAFFAWFVQDVLGRWDKMTISAAILQDWHGRLWAKYGADTATEAVAGHRAETDGWNPKFSAVLKKAGTIQRRAEQHHKRVQETQQREEIVTKPGRSPYKTMTVEEGVELYRNGTGFDRVQLQKRRPDVMEHLKQSAGGKGP